MYFDKEAKQLFQLFIFHNEHIIVVTLYDFSITDYFSLLVCL